MTSVETFVLSVFVRRFSQASSSLIITVRYNAYAKARALLIDSALQIPMVAIGGVPRVSKGVPI